MTSRKEMKEKRKKEEKEKSVLNSAWQIQSPIGHDPNKASPKTGSEKKKLLSRLQFKLSVKHSS